MAVHPFVAAKRVCELRSGGASNLVTNKILYVVQMVSLGRSRGDDPLIAGSFEAWDYGPVLPVVYRRAKIFGSDPVPPSVFDMNVGCLNATQDGIVGEVIEAVKNMSPGQLVALTHREDGAWATHYVAGEHGIVIPNEDILKEYSVLIREH